MSPYLHAISNSLFGPQQGCRYTPSCSQYVKESIKKYGIIQGAKLSFLRLLRCNPLFPGDHDPVI